MAAHYFNTVENTVTGKPVSGATVLVTDNSDGAITIWSDDGVTTVPSSTVTSDSTGFFEFWTNETSVKLVISYDGEVKRTITDVEMVGGSVSSDVTALQTRVDNHDTVLGLTANATSLGTFTGSTIADNSAVKVALQALETAVEAATPSDDAYDATSWNGSLVAPTKNAVRDKIETISASIYSGGKQTIPILASAMTPRTTNGAAEGTSESTTNKVMLRTLDFDQSTIEYAQIVLPMPKSWDESTVTAQFIWTAGATGNVIWACQGIALSDDDAVDTAFGTAQTVTDGVTASGDVMISSETSAITIGGSPAEGDLVVFQFYRNASDGSDTLAADAKLIAVKLFITTNAATDA